MANDGGVWVKLEDAGSSAPAGAAVINDAASNYDNKDAGVTIDGKTYDIYTFTTATTTRSMFLTDEAQARITDEDLLMAVATTPIPDDFTGDPVELFDEKYRNQLRNAFEITPAADPGLSLTVDTGGAADILLVGGGGPGGSNQNNGQAAGGGGGGGVLTTVIGDAGGRGTQGETSIVPRYLNKGVHKVNVGAGGAATAWTGSPAPNGKDTHFGEWFIAYGGGRGRTVRSGSTWVNANNGASGGGSGGLGMDFQGFDSSGAGGGGAGSASNGNAGGDGVISNITGAPVTYGAGGEVNGAGTSASPNTGNGGSNGNPGGSGGSGIVIVRVEI